ncbi:hypothetical protein GJAV_G00104880 [Gymnothorax javanicus]|nr:hypothetical protein GJAV_G00104880 [Gymnothorax javanicus]
MRAANSAKVLLFLQIVLSSLAKTPIVRISVPEGYYIVLICPGRDPSDPAPLEWTGGDGQVLAAIHSRKSTIHNIEKYSLLTDGSLYIRSLQPGDSGEFRCGDLVAADLEVLTGQDYDVQAGRTVQLVCKVTETHKQKWTFRISKGSERQTIFIRHKNGTVSKEIEDPQSRLTLLTDNTLQISHLRPSDGGEYWCNGKKAATLAVRTEKPDHTNPAAGTTEETDADVADIDDSDHGKVPVAVLIGLCIMILLAGVLIIILMIRLKHKRGRERGPRQLHSPAPADENRHSVSMVVEEPHIDTQGDPRLTAGEVHYASLHLVWLVGRTGGRGLRCLCAQPETSCDLLHCCWSCRVIHPSAQWHVGGLAHDR